MLEHGGEVVKKWLHILCNLPWMCGEVPVDWFKTVIVPIYEGKFHRYAYGGYTDKSLLSIPKAGLQVGHRDPGINTERDWKVLLFSIRKTLCGPIV